MAKSKGEWIKTSFIGIEKRESDGKYRVMLDYGVVNDYNEKKGKMETRRIKTRKVVDTLGEAKKLRAQIQVGKDSGISAKAGTQKMKDVVDVYWERESSRFASSTVSSKQHHLRLINEYMGNVQIKDIQKNMVEDFCNYMYEKKHLQRNSIVKVKSSLSCVFRFMMGDPATYGITSNPCVLPDYNIKAPILKRGAGAFEPSPLSIDEVNITINDIIAYEDDRSLLAIYALRVIGGLRRSEIAGLTKGAFYAEKDKMLIKDVVVKGEHFRNVKKDCTKDGAFRYVARPKILTEIIEYCMKQTATLQGYRSIKEIPDTDRIVRPVIEILKNKEVQADKLTERWKDYQNRRNNRLKAVNKEPIKIVRLHDLRHTHAHIIVEGGVNTYFISQNMGHSLTGSRYATTTEAVYLKDNNDRNRINAFFNNKETCPIKIDWSRSNKLILNSSNASIDGSGHLKIN